MRYATKYARVDIRFLGFVEAIKIITDDIILLNVTWTSGVSVSRIKGEFYFIVFIQQLPILRHTSFLDNGHVFVVHPYLMKIAWSPF